MLYNLIKDEYPIYWKSNKIDTGNYFGTTKEHTNKIKMYKNK